MKIRKKSILIFFNFLLLVIANSNYVYSIGYNTQLEYLVCAILVLLSLYYFLKSDFSNRRRMIVLFFAVTILFSLGIILQNMPFSDKFRLVATMVTIATYILLSGKLLNNYVLIRSASLGIFFGIFVSLLLALISHISLTDGMVSGNAFWILYKNTFNGGIHYKNYYAVTLLAAYIGCYLHYKYERKDILDLFVMFISFILMYFSGSKGGILIFFIYIFLCSIYNFNKIKHKRFDKATKNVFKIFLFVIFIYLFKLIYDGYMSQTATYLYRIRGVKNYIDFVLKNPFYFWFGYAEMAFKSGNEYVANIRIFLSAQGYNGYDGSYEMGFINTFIKSGVLGLIGYLICYYTLIKSALKCKNSDIKANTLIIIFVLLATSLVESYICSLHGVFGIYSYLVISGLLSQENSINLNIKKIV